MHESGERVLSAPDARLTPSPSRRGPLSFKSAPGKADDFPLRASSANDGDDFLKRCLGARRENPVSVELFW